MDVNQVESSNQLLSKYQEKAKLNKEKQDFFKLYLTSMKNQDPTNPTDTSNLAQLNMMFQNTSSMIDIKQMINKVYTNSSKDFINMANIFNDNVNIKLKDDNLYLSSINSKNGKKLNCPTIDYEVSQSLKSIEFIIKDQYGNVVNINKQSFKSPGIYSYRWDGNISEKDEHGLSRDIAAEEGMYKIDVIGMTSDDEKIKIPTFIKVKPESYDMNGDIVYSYINSELKNKSHRDDIVGFVRDSNAKLISSIATKFNEKVEI